MARITPLQKEIFDRHLRAFETDTWDDVSISVNVKTSQDVFTQIKMWMLEGKTVKHLWTGLWEKNISITSQLMAMPSLMGVVSGVAKAEMRTAFKDFLNSKHINIK